METESIKSDKLATNLQQRIEEIRLLAIDTDWKSREKGGFELRNLFADNFESIQPILTAWMNDKNERIRRAAVLACMQKKLHEQPYRVIRILDMLEISLDDTSRYVRKCHGPFVLGYLGYTYPTIVLPRIEQWSRVKKRQYERWNIASAFSQAFGRRYPDEAIKVLTLLASDSRQLVWKAVASSLKNVSQVRPEEIRRKCLKWIETEERRKPAQRVLKIF